MSKPWEYLMFVKEIVFTATDPLHASRPVVEEEYEDGQMFNYNSMNVCVASPRSVNVRFGNDWTTKYIGDYPEDFKKLAMRLGRPLAYEAYMALKATLKDNWSEIADLSEERHK